MLDAWYELPYLLRAADFLWASLVVLVLAIDGVKLLCNPGPRFARMELVTNQEGRADLRATYGSAHLNTALIIVISLIVPELRQLAVPLVLLMFVSIVLCRWIGMKLEGLSGGLNQKALLVEVAGTLITLLLLAFRFAQMSLP